MRTGSRFIHDGVDVDGQQPASSIGIPFSDGYYVKETMGGYAILWSPDYKNYHVFSIEGKKRVVLQGYPTTFPTVEAARDFVKVLITTDRFGGDFNAMTAAQSMAAANAMNWLNVNIQSLLIEHGYDGNGSVIPPVSQTPQTENSQKNSAEPLGAIFRALYALYYTLSKDEFEGRKLVIPAEVKEMILAYAKLQKETNAPPTGVLIQSLPTPPDNEGKPYSADTFVEQTGQTYSEIIGGYYAPPADRVALRKNDIPPDVLKRENNTRQTSTPPPPPTNPSDDDLKRTSTYVPVAPLPATPPEPKKINPLLVGVFGLGALYVFTKVIKK